MRFQMNYALLESSAYHFLIVVILTLLFLCDCSHGAQKGLKDITDDLKLVTEDFRTLIGTGIYVDKSLFINETLQCEDVVLQITRPRKWGKTLNLDMLRRFFEIEFDRNGNRLPQEKKVNPMLFKGGKATINGKRVTLSPLKVSGLDDVMGHLGNHPVIYLSLKDVKGRNYKQFEESLKNLVTDLFLSYPFLNKILEDDSDILSVQERVRLAHFITGKATDEHFIGCLEFLSMILYKHFNSEVCIFIDDYDFPIIHAFLQLGDKNKEFDSIIILFRVLFENAFKENQYLLKGIITGTLNFFVVASGISEYHYVGFNTVLDKQFSSFYGFTQKDIGELMGRSTIMFNAIEIRKWYGGYHIHGEEFYNPGSVMKCLSKKGKYDYYLQNTVDDYSRLIEKAFITEEIQDYFHLLIEGKEIVRSQLEESVYLRAVSGDFFSVFVHIGYLERIPPAKMNDHPIWRMKIPNKDVTGVFAAGMGKWAAQELELSDTEYEHFVNLLVSRQVDKFGEELEQLLTLNACGDHTQQRYYHNLMTGIVCSLGMKYLIESVKDYSQGKGGDILVPYEKYGNIVIYIEYSVCKSTEDFKNVVDVAFEDLEKKPRPFSQKIEDHVHVKKRMNLAIGFSGAKVLIKHDIISIKQEEIDSV